ncbi:MAG: DUF4230 domain-containing protein [Caldilineales bacterium]|nr:DUF4230 domain-containing protein [Caldilineales bacterium]
MTELTKYNEESFHQEPITPPPNQSGGCLRSIPFIIIVVLSLIIVLLVANSFRNFFRPEPTPAPTPTPPIITINNIRSLAELATVEMTAIIVGEDERIRDDILRYLGGREYVLMLIYGDIKAGFDLQDMKVEDLWMDGRRVQLTLPPPKILSTSIDFDQTRLVDYETSILVGDDPEFEKNVLADAVPLLERAAIEAGILQRAKEYGALYFENHLRSLGFEEVRVVTEEVQLE